jgi:hypothetical protein
MVIEVGQIVKGLILNEAVLITQMLLYCTAASKVR